jgi:hypothetical protein
LGSGEERGRGGKAGKGRRDEREEARVRDQGGWGGHGGESSGEARPWKFEKRYAQFKEKEKRK